MFSRNALYEFTTYITLRHIIAKMDRKSAGTCRANQLTGPHASPDANTTFQAVHKQHDTSYDDNEKGPLRHDDCKLSPFGTAKRLVDRHNTRKQNFLFGDWGDLGI